MIQSHDQQRDELTIDELRIIEAALLRRIIYMECSEGKTPYSRQKSVEAELVMEKIIKMIKRKEFESQISD